MSVILVGIILCREENMIKTILACVSSGDSGQTVLETVGRIAKRFDSHIEVLHVRADPRVLVP